MMNYGLLDLKEDDTYYFDAVAAERPISLAEKYIFHYEGPKVGQPFLLHPIQKRIIRDIYGWKCRDTGLRRFTDVWFEAAVGAGKSPLLAILGIYGLGFDGEAGAQVYSLAATYQQAKTVFDNAKNFILASKPLFERFQVTQYEIRHLKSKSVWKIVSGKPKAGARPSLTLADEIHEWKSREIFDSLQSRQGKRQQPLFFCATNTGETRQSLYWQLREKAVAVLEGKGDPSLYPIIWKAPDGADAGDPEAWKAANPLIGTTISEIKVKAEYDKSVGDPVLTARFERLYLSRMAQGDKKWLNIAQWDNCTKEIDAEKLKGAPLYVGVDLSEGDDLCAVDLVWMNAGKAHVTSHFWLPRVTADHYEKEGIQYKTWAEQGHLTLLDGPTVSSEARQQIAQWIIEQTKGHRLKAVCYDRYRADDCIAALEDDGLTCLPIPQGFSISPGCAELDRRLKEESIVISPNPVLRACAEQVEVKYDERGNFWPVKPGAKGKFQGKRSVKIDGITALVTALTEARKANFPTARKRFNGPAALIIKGKE